MCAETKRDGEDRKYHAPHGPDLQPAWLAAVLLGLASLGLALLAYAGCATAMSAWISAFDACAAAEQEG